MRAFATGDGKQVWEYDTLRDFTTVNGVAAKGGAMGAPGPTVAGGMLFVGSGYTGLGNGRGGNVLLAFGLGVKPKSQIPNSKSQSQIPTRRWGLGFGIWACGIF